MFYDFYKISSAGGKKSRPSSPKNHVEFLFPMVAILALYMSACTIAADDVSRFEAFAKQSFDLTVQNNPVYLNTHTKKWAKRFFYIADLKYDVKKTDSLINPVVGIINFNLRCDQSRFYGSEKEAESSMDVNPELPSNYYQVMLTYVPKNNKWIFKSGQYTTRLGSEFPVTIKNVLEEPNAIPHVALKHWIIEHF